MAIRWWSAGLADLPSDTGWIDDAERHRFGSMRYRKRRDEAMLARWTAKSTVARALGMPTDPAGLAAITVRNASDGAPEVSVEGRPAELIIGMTDRADWAVTAVLFGQARIGCDLELVEPRSEAFVADYFTEAEQAPVADAPNRDLAANLIWSAKESALKVLRTGLRKDTREVEVDYHPEGDGEWSPLVVRADDGREMPGWWTRYGSFVLTMAAAVETSPPVSLERPPGLASAEPGHSWMEAPQLKGS